MTPIDRIIDTLDRLDCRPRRTRDGWIARCPSHDDRNPSLSIGEAADGRVLLHCHATCTFEQVCAALGVAPSDLFEPSTSTILQFPRKSSEYRRQDSQKAPATQYASAAEAIDALERTLGPAAAQWTYQHEDGQPAFMVIRWNLADGKKMFRPITREGGSWYVKGMSPPRLLYRLPNLASATTVYVCEGEKAAEAARSIGLVATTSANGSSGADKTDWQPLAGKEIIILPDNNVAGEKYAGDVVSRLAKVSPSPTVKMLRLPGLPEGGDIADYIDAQADQTDLRCDIEEMADEAEIVQLPTPPNDKFLPFPVHALPELIRRFVVQGAKAIGCDPSYLALPLLTVLGAAIGNTRHLQLKRGWTVPPVLWAAIVGESGTAKTPAFRLVMRGVKEHQRKAIDIHNEEMRQYEIELANYEKELAKWKREDQGLEPPSKPVEPQATRFFVSDTTVEALAPLLHANPCGLLLFRDELAAWLGSFDRYAVGKSSSDAAQWLSMYNGETIMVDRKSGTPRTLFVPMASVSVCGGIQPAILNRALGTEHRDSGLAARLLLVYPPRRPKRWTEAEVDSALEAEIENLLKNLYELKFGKDDFGVLRPVIVGLTPEAKQLFEAFFDRHADEHVDLDGDLAAAWSKLEECPARLALIIHLIRCKTWSTENESVVDADSMQAALTLAEWFKHETRRVYAVLSEAGEDRDLRRLVEWINRRGGTVTSRDVQHGCRWLKGSGEAEQALMKLVHAGRGTWEQSPPGQRGQPTRRFKLLNVTSNGSPFDENEDCDDVDGRNVGPKHEWCEL